MTDNRVFILVMDSAGVGEMPDAANYGDAGANTLGHVAQAVGGLNLPNLLKLGLGNILELQGVPPTNEPAGACGKMAEKSAGKDSTTGHWELAGLVTDKPFPLFPDGFPPEVIEPFEQAIRRRVLGNVAASGTEIIQRFGENHLHTGRPIVYTSADSVFQIACHEDVVPVEELYEMCRKARAILSPPYGVSRVIARPFVGRPGSFVRTERRRDFSLPPPGRTLLDAAAECGLGVLAIGKTEDLFANRGVTRSQHTLTDAAGMRALARAAEEAEERLVFANVVDLDMLFGHRNNVHGYATGLEKIDHALAPVLESLRKSDFLIITADHGNDPTDPSTDHSREYVPVIVTGPEVRPAVDLNLRPTFADVAATAADLLGIELECPGTSFAGMLS